MRQRKIITTTLGELVVAVTDEVIPFVDDPSSLYMVVSCILGDLVAHNHLRLRRRSRPKYPSYLGKALR
jgi:hypothetical protein